MLTKSFRELAGGMASGGGGPVGAVLARDKADSVGLNICVALIAAKHRSHRLFVYRASNVLSNTRTLVNVS
ncbi:hypothetical protein [Pseudomonas syringae]|uniref:hypothetical protein n=1 Tax=Pseudomonas syringae TaxID=317 RepID=UPI0018A2298F